MKFLLLLHILALIYWLGTDLGVYYSSKFIKNTSLSLETRLTVIKIAWLLDLVPRIAMPLMFFSGIFYAEYVGLVLLSDFAIGLVYLATIVWLGLVGGVYFGEKYSFHALLRDIDIYFRIFILFLLWLWVGYSLYYNAIVEKSLQNTSDEVFDTFEQLIPLVEPLSYWMSAKILIFTITVVCGLGIRYILKPFPNYIKQLVSDPVSETANAGISQCLKRTTPLVHGIWFCILLNVLLGLHIINV
ncbi:MAG: hypothetical protein QM538_04135 [Methylacidiphilales bacterium]|nr:hypothetical protein [Candidatus Methylacidiphilales bacterium]